MDRIRACIIGGGGTGAALSWDLAQRGFEVSLFEKGELCSGTTGRHHGQLHCGARYVTQDKNIARECHEETLILRRIAREAIEFNGGIFVAVNDDDADFAPVFLESCSEAGIPASEIPVAEALAREPALNPKIKRAVWVPDGTLDAFRLPMRFFAAALSLGADIRPFHEVLGFNIAGGRLASARVRDLAVGKEFDLGADLFFNATGAWAGELAALAGVHVPVTPAPGTMVAVKGRIFDMVISRLRAPTDGDIIVPQRRLSIIGSTQGRPDSPDALLPPREEVEFLLSCADELCPGFSRAPFHAAWRAARPLYGESSGGEEGRKLSRDFAVVDHEATGGPANFLSIVGGKATVLRAMAEKAADLACAKFGLGATCKTAETVLPDWRGFYRRKAGI